MIKRKVVAREENVSFVSTPPTPIQVELLFKENFPKLSWASRYPIVKIEVIQGEEKVSYLFSNYENFLEFDLKLFGNFKPNTKARIEVSEASSLTGSAASRNS